MKRPDLLEKPAKITQTTGRPHEQYTRSPHRSKPESVRRPPRKGKPKMKMRTVEMPSRAIAEAVGNDLRAQFSDADTLLILTAREIPADHGGPGIADVDATFDGACEEAVLLLAGQDADLLQRVAEAASKLLAEVEG